MRRRVLLLTICLPALIVLQLKANVEPPTLTVTVNGPAVGLLGSTVKFTARVSKTGNGGNGIYTYEWKVKYNGVENEEDETGNTCSYEIPDGDTDAKEVTVVCTATDTGDSSITGSGEKQFLQMKITIEHDASHNRDSDDIQVQYFTNRAGIFTYTAIPLNLYYNLEPGDGWPQKLVALEIKTAAGNTVKTIDLASEVGQQQTTWNGMNEQGDFVALGNYVAKIKITVDDKDYAVESPFAVYEIRQANCAYTHWIGPEYHCAIVYEYKGGNTINDINGLNNYTVFEHPGEGGGNDTRIASMAGHTWDYWCPPELTHEQRKAILERAANLAARTIPYVSEGNFLGNNSIVHNDNPISPRGTDWAGTIQDIAQLRCDGAVEAAYEAAGVRLWGDSRWNVMTPGASGNLSYNNSSILTGLTPSKQRSSSLSQNKLDALHKP